MVVDKPQILRFYVEELVRGNGRTALRTSLMYFVIDIRPEHFARRVVRNGILHAVRVAQNARVNGRESVDRA